MGGENNGAMAQRHNEDTAGGGGGGGDTRDARRKLGGCHAYTSWLQAASNVYARYESSAYRMHEDDLCVMLCSSVCGRNRGRKVLLPLPSWGLGLGLGRGRER